jgi:FKBP-type peptidyl-prolyl cis-trans isomerase
MKTICHHFERHLHLLAVLWVVVVHSLAPSFSRPSQIDDKARAFTINSRLLSTSASESSTTFPEGLVKTITTPGSGDRAKLGDIVTVKYSCYVPNSDGTHDNNKPFAKATKQKMVRIAIREGNGTRSRHLHGYDIDACNLVHLAFGTLWWYLDALFSDSFFVYIPFYFFIQVVGDGTMIPGWDQALRSMSVGERAVIRIVDPELAYGDTGVPSLVPPNSPIEMDVELFDVQPPTWKIDFDSLALSDNTPVSWQPFVWEGG